MENRNTKNCGARKIVRYCFIVISFSIFNFQFSIAQEDLSKQLEVTRQYTPRVARAEKLPIKPDMTDTVRLRPEISYSITSTASATSFDTRPYEAATVSTASFDRQKPLYVRAGAGLPLRTVFDLYFTPRMRTGSTFGLFANHSGSFSKLTNDIGVKAPATEMTNGVGVWGSRRWKQYALTGDLTYDNRRYDLYGYAADLRPEQDTPFEHERAKWSRVGGRIGFGDDFTDLSRLNFRVGLDGGYTRLGGDPGGAVMEPNHKDPSQTDTGLSLRVSKMLSDRQGFDAELKARYGKTYVDYGIRTSNEAVDVISNNTFGSASVALRYILEFEKFHLRVGGDMFYIKNRHFGQDRVRVFPAGEVSFDIADDRFVPFVSLSSHIMDGSMEALSRRNPYIYRDGATGLATDLRGGIMGDFGDVFSYKLSVGASSLKDHNVTAPLFTLLSPVMFYPVATNGSQFTAGVELGVRAFGGFSAKLHGNWYRNNFDKMKLYGVETDATWLPDFDAGAVLSYSYKDRFSLSVGVDATGRREYLYPVYSGNDFSPEVRSIAPVADLFLGTEMKVARDFWVWAEGRNLANQALYPYPYYRGLGAGVMAGVKMVF